MARRKRSTVLSRRKRSVAPSRRSITHGRRRSATMGKVLPPIEVKSPSDLPSLKRVFGNSQQFQHLILVVFVNKNCPHCVEYKKHWNEAVRSPQRSVEAVQVHDHMINDFNDFIHQNVNQRNTPIDIDGVPTVKMMNANGDVLADLEPVKNTETLTKVMNQSTSLASNAGLLSPSPNAPSPIAPSPNAPISSRPPNTGSLAPTATMNNSLYAMESVPSNQPVRNLISLSDQEEAIRVEPPSLSDDLIQNSASRSVNQKLRGGSLFGALSRTAYSLAPAAVLMGLAATTLKPRRTKRRMRHRRS